MLGLIKRILSKKSKINETLKIPKLKVRPDNSNFITDTAQIETLLIDLEQQTPLCTVKIDHYKETFTTTLLEIQGNMGLIYFDELSPSHGNELIKKRPRIEIAARYHHIRIEFSLDRLVADTAAGVVYYKAKLPKKVYYPQQRQSQRHDILPQALMLSCTLSRSLSIIGHVVDISQGGLGVEIEDTNASLQRGDKLQNCQLHLPENEMVNLELSVCFAKSIRCGTRVKFGAYFDDLSEMERIKLDRYMATLENKSLAKIALGL